VAGAREEHRNRQLALIRDTARRLLATHGAQGLSLREVAREMGVASSALYRYYSTRDELLTALILDAYNDLGSAAERAEAKIDRGSHRARLHAATQAIRRWALRHPHEYALIFGTPVPQYVAPDDTILAAGRVTALLGGIVADAAGGDTLVVPPAQRTMLEWENVALVTGSASAPRVIWALTTWTTVFGFVNFELFGHFVGSVRKPEQFLRVVVDELADQLGLR